MDPLIVSTFHDNGCYLETQSRKKETTINKIYIDPKDKRFKEAILLAKNLFIKRTRTLYNWLYPSVTRKQINQLVLKTWENLPNEEKNKQIIQVLNDKHPQQLKAQVNPQVFDLFQGHISTSDNETQVSDINQQHALSLVPTTETTTSFSSLAFLNDLNDDSGMTITAGDTTITASDALMMTRSVDDPDDQSFLSGKRKTLNDENCSSDAIYSYFNSDDSIVDSRKRIKLEGTTNEFFEPNLTRNMFDDFDNDPELNKEFQEFANNVDQTYLKL